MRKLYCQTIQKVFMPVQEIINNNDIKLDKSYCRVCKWILTQLQSNIERYWIVPQLDGAPTNCHADDCDTQCNPNDHLNSYSPQHLDFDLRWPPICGKPDRILPPCNYCHHPWCVGHKSYHKALLIMFSCDGISDHANWNEVFQYWDTKLSCVIILSNE